MASSDGYGELTVVPRVAVSFPLPLPLPDGFAPERAETWPPVPGRLEYREGSLLYMPPFGDLQLKTAADVVTELSSWRRTHKEFVVGANEAGMLLGGEVRGADAAVWRSADLGPDTGGFPRAAPVLAVEIAGKDEEVDALLAKAEWYLGHGVAVVWVLEPVTRSARVVTRAGTVTLSHSERMPEAPELPGLGPLVADLFQQVSGH